MSILKEHLRWLFLMAMIILNIVTGSAQEYKNAIPLQNVIL